MVVTVRFADSMVIRVAPRASHGWLVGMPWIQWVGRPFDPRIPRPYARVFPTSIREGYRQSDDNNAHVSGEEWPGRVA